MIDWLQGLAADVHPVLQWLVVILAGAIPFVESYFASVIGILAGIPWFVAIPAAIVGNVVSMVLFVLTAAGVRKAAKRDEREESPRRQRLRRQFDRWGVPGVSLLGQTILPSQITSAAMVGFGASRQRVIGWQIVSIILWGVAFGVLALLGVELLGG